MLASTSAAVHFGEHAHHTRLPGWHCQSEGALKTQGVQPRIQRAPRGQGYTLDGTATIRSGATCTRWSLAGAGLIRDYLQLGTLRGEPNTIVHAKRINNGLSQASVMERQAFCP